MSQKTSGIYNFFSYPLFYSLTQKIMSGEAQRSKIVRNVIKENSNVLDIGCGTAKIIESIPPVNYYGYDISKVYIKHAKKKYYSSKIKFFCKRFTQSEIKKLPKFDYVLLFGIIHHLNDREVSNLFLLLKKILKQKGKLLTCDPVFIKKQNILAKFLLNNDVGDNIRNKNGYLKLFNKHFKKIKSKLNVQKLIPYAWFSTECQK